MNRFPLRASRPRLLRATWLALFAACASAALVVGESALAQAVPMDAGASPTGSLPQGHPESASGALEASSADVSEVALPATRAGTAPPSSPSPLQTSSAMWRGVSLHRRPLVASPAAVRLKSTRETVRCTYRWKPSIQTCIRIW